MRTLTMHLPLCILLAACAGGNGLSVDLRTDFVPSLEFDTVLFAIDGESSTVLPRVLDANFETGVRLVDLEGVVDGDHLLRVELRLVDTPVAAREVLVRIAGDRSVTVALPRSCDGTVCPGAGPASSCLGGRCVDPRCVTGLEPECPAAQCETDTDCPSGGVACLMPRCIDAVCYSLASDEACPSGLLCSPREGCVDARAPDAGPGDAGGDAPLTDAGDDAGARDAGDDAGIDAGPDAGFTPSGGLDFDGIDDVLVVPNAFTVGTGNWSLELWFYYPAASPDQGALFTALDAPGRGVGFHFINLFGPMRSDIAREEARPVLPTCLVSSTTRTARSDIYDRWIQLVVVSETNTVGTIYFDGIEHRANSGGMHSVGVGDIRIGGPRLCASTAHTRLSLSNIRLWSRALGAPEIAELSAGIGPPADAPGLVGWWPLDEGSGQAAANRVAGGVDGTLGEATSPDAADPRWR